MPSSLKLSKLENSRTSANKSHLFDLHDFNPSEFDRDSQYLTRLKIKEDRNKIDIKHNLVNQFIKKETKVKERLENHMRYLMKNNL